MPNAALIASDPLIALNFFLEIDGEVVSILASVSGLDIELEVATAQQIGKSGKSETVKTLAGRNKVGDLSLVRLAAIDSTSDKLWVWFHKIRTGGMAALARDTNRKNGSVVLYDSTHTEVARFNFTNGWPSKISTDQLSVDSNDPVKETITLVIETLERVK
jgi:phage tail-like protein